MSKNLQIGNEIYEYPVQGDGSWGEEATAWAEGVTEALQTVQGPNDVLLSTALLTNNQTSPTDVSGLAFNTSQVLSVQVDYFIKREGSTILVESGTLEANFDGSDWKLQADGVGDAGTDFTITAAGQVQYTTTDLAGHTSSQVRFRAKTIDIA